MNRFLALVTLLLALVVTPQPVAAQSADEMRAGFQAIIDDLNDNTFRKFGDAIDERAFVNRVSGTRVIENDAKEAFAADIDETIQAMFVSMFPLARSLDEQGDIIGTLISFEEQDGQARAVVRYESKGYRFTYHSYDLIRGRGGRIQIVDWFDYYHGAWFSEEAGDMLVRTMPSQAAVASILEIPNPSEAQLFQVGELLKTIRDNDWGRYFQIHEGLEEPIRKELFIVHQHYQLSSHIAATYSLQADIAGREQLSDEDRARARGLTQAARQADRQLDEAVRELLGYFPGDGRYSLSLAHYFILRGQFEEAITQYEVFQNTLGMKDGATESMKATAAMALGDFERAQAFALSATEAEPTLELGWWALLRTRTAAEDYSGATEALTQLEDRFGHLLIPQKLRRDRFLRALIDQQAYKDWRAGRDAT